MFPTHHLNKSNAYAYPKPPRIPRPFPPYPPVYPNPAAPYPAYPSPAPPRPTPRRPALPRPAYPMGAAATPAYPSPAAPAYPPVSVGSVGDQVNGCWVLVGGSGFVGLDLSSKSTVVSDVVDFSANSTSIGESVASSDSVSSIPRFFSVLLTMVVLHAVPKLVGLRCMMVDGLKSKCNHFNLTF
ncbi:hypothetical protein TNIN_366801 [Trichonephila inaurata madagascariensis]|uniref:Uncharacterized protein n=1 Tax=Trichonephila inaurata madagascariensis TaxID=2747483 RepID=A0A8X6YAE6_9ARAC|nr:hypothetical protein TNIN_366801 [Trichonephila inaurata madagascariensis]